MINPLNKTEYSFRYAYGKIKDIISNNIDNSIVIADRYTTFGHIPFYKLCRKNNKKPILGVELAFVNDATLKNRQNPNYVTLLAINPKGLKKIYELVTKSTAQKYYYNRLSKDELRGINEKDVIVIYKEENIDEYLINRKNTYFAVTPITPYKEILHSKHPLVAASDNIYDRAESEPLYQIIMGNGQWEDRTYPGHVMSSGEWEYECSHFPKEIINKALIATIVIKNTIENFDLPKANLPKHTEPRSLEQLCIEGAKVRGCDLGRKNYNDRLKRELKLIKEKKYEDYFYLVWDLVVWAKEKMLVGPARGSSAGSLVCYLLFITDVDPIPFNLIFERFVDINRFDTPDIDIDFQDTERDKIIGYLKDKYGRDYVAKLGTVSKYKPKSILTELAKILNIPSWEISDLKNIIPERDKGDKRYSNCIEDTFNDLEIGKKFLEKYPNLIYAKDIESHNRHFGQHAAGIVVSDMPINNFCAIEYNSDGCMLDKNDAEEINLLKMDCLGLRTLSVIQDCLDLIKKDRHWILNFPLNDESVFNVINEKRFSGIFQFEGDALKNLAKKTLVKNIEDVSAINASARPGPLGSGGAQKYIDYKNNPEKITYLSNCKEYTKETYGIIIYQEQVMSIVKNIGNLSWGDTSKIRKIMSKTLGDEALSVYKNKFIEGAKIKFKMSLKDSTIIWNSMSAMGGYAFNKSHSISYGIVSYWCMILKRYYPLEFAISTLKNAKDNEQSINILKELVKEGYEYKTFDRELSEVDWSIQNKVLVGGFINIKGIGQKKARNFIKKRKDKTALTVNEKKMLYNAETPYDAIFEFKEKFTPFYENWNLFFKDKPCLIEDVEEGEEIRYICKTIKISIRDMNEEILIKKRNGKVIENAPVTFLDLKMADDTASIRGRISTELFEKFGRNISENDKIGTYYLVFGWCCKGFKYIIVKNIKKITEEEVLKKISESKEKDNE